jgi:hypothetical protein
LDSKKEQGDKARELAERLHEYGRLIEELSKEERLQPSQLGGKDDIQPVESCEARKSEDWQERYSG